jgi:hypothetical protein
MMSHKRVLDAGSVEALSGCVDTDQACEAKMLPRQYIRTVQADEGRTRAVEALGEEDAFAVEAVKRRCKLELGDGEGVTQMEDTVHVWVREVSKPLAFWDSIAVGWCIALEELGVFPTLLGGVLECD